MVRGRSDRGAGLILAILACALIGMAVMLLSDDLNHGQRLFRQEARLITVDHLSDAAFAETLAALAMDPEFPGIAIREIGSGVIWSRVERLEPGRFSVITEAVFDQWRGVLEAEVLLDDNGPRVEEWHKYTEPDQGSSRLLRRKSSSLL